MKARPIKVGIFGTLGIACQGAVNTLMADDGSPHSLSATLTVTSNYLFRGISQTNNGPAIQGSVDYTYVPLSLYAYVWSSNVFTPEYDDSSVDQGDQGLASAPGDPNARYQPRVNSAYKSGMVELDLGVGWAPTFGRLGVDVGYVRYQYPGTKTESNNTNEYHLGLSYDVLGHLKPKFTVNFSDSFFGYGSAWYYDLAVDASLPLKFNVSAHYGWTRYNNSVNHGGGYAYDDFSVSLTRELYKGIILTAAWIDRNKTKQCQSPFPCGSTAVFSLSKTF